MKDNKKDMKKPGSSWGTGRPSTGRTHPVTVRLSDEAYEALGKVTNKSLYIDCLIQIDYMTDPDFFLPTEKLNGK